MGHSHFSLPRLNQASSGAYPLFISCYISSTIWQRKLNLITAVSPFLVVWLRKVSYMGVWRGDHIDPQGKSEDKMTGKVGKNKTPTLCYSFTSTIFFFGKLTQAALAKVVRFTLAASWMPHHASQYHLSLLEKQWSSTFAPLFLANLLNTNSKGMLPFSHSQPVPSEHQKTTHLYLSGSGWVLWKKKTELISLCEPVKAQDRAKEAARQTFGCSLGRKGNVGGSDSRH